MDTLDDVDIDDDVDTELEVDTLTGKKSHYLQKFKDVQITCYDTELFKDCEEKTASCLYSLWCLVLFVSFYLS